MSGWRRTPSIYPLRLSVYLFTRCLTSTMYRYNDNAPDTSPALTTNTLAALVCQSLFSPSQSLLPSSRHYHVAHLRLHAFVLGYIVLLIQLQEYLYGLYWPLSLGLHNGPSRWATFLFCGVQGPQNLVWPTAILVHLLVCASYPSGCP